METIKFFLPFTYRYFSVDDNDIAVTFEFQGNGFTNINLLASKNYFNSDLLGQKGLSIIPYNPYFKNISNSAQQFAGVQGWFSAMQKYNCNYNKSLLHRDKTLFYETKIKLNAPRPQDSPANLIFVQYRNEKGQIFQTDTYNYFDSITDMSKNKNSYKFNINHKSDVVITFITIVDESENSSRGFAFEIESKPFMIPNNKINNIENMNILC